jgi:hypothetical protein
MRIKGEDLLSEPDRRLELCAGGRELLPGVKDLALYFGYG